ncbi:MAG: hypothetical protein MUE82_11125 [Chloroflexi bacterium]|nr:hypothetical protein [Chloroflexota bacterium]
MTTTPVPGATNRYQTDFVRLGLQYDTGVTPGAVTPVGSPVSTLAALMSTVMGVVRSGGYGNDVISCALSNMSFGGGTAAHTVAGASRVRTNAALRAAAARRRMRILPGTHRGGSGPPVARRGPGGRGMGRVSSPPAV